MRYFYLILISGLLPVANSYSASGKIVKKFEFGCYTSMESGLKFQKSIKFPIEFKVDPDGFIFTSQKEFVKFIKNKKLISKSASAIECIDSFVYRVQDEIAAVCKKLNTAKSNLNCHPLQTQMNAAQVGINLLAELERSNEMIANSRPSGPIFYPMEKLSPAMRPQAKKIYPKILEKIKKSCTAFFSEKFQDYGSLAMSETFMMEFLLPYLNEEEADSCRKQILKNYGDWYRANRLENCSDEPEESEESKKANCKRFATAYQKFSNNFMSGITDTESLFAYASCNNKPYSKKDRLDFLGQELNQIANCYELKTGEAKRITSPAKEEGQLKSNYRLVKRKSHYEAQVNLNFKPEHLQAKYLAKTKECIDKANEDLDLFPPQGLAPGIKFKFGFSSLAPTSEIRIESPEFRSHSGSWESDIDCNIVIHGLGHILGLVDENVDKDKHKPQFQCRLIPARPSIMGQTELYMQPISRDPKITLLDSYQIRTIVFPGCTSTNAIIKLDDIPAHCQGVPAAHLKED